MCCSAYLFHCYTNPAAGALPDVLQLLLTSRQSPPSTAAARANQGDRLGHAVAALYASDGRGPDRSRLDVERGAAVSRTAVATASGGVSTQGRGKWQDEVACADDVRLHGLLRGHPQGSEGRWEAMRVPSLYLFVPMEVDG